MRPAPGFIRVHLLTLLFAMLTTGVVLGLNLQQNETSQFSFRATSPYTWNTTTFEPAIVVEYVGRRNFGWPWPLAHHRAYSQTYVKLDDILPAEAAVLHLRTRQCETYTLTEAVFSRVAPALFARVALERGRYSPILSWNEFDILQYVCGYLALLFTAMLLLECHIRRVSNPEQDPELLPEV